MKISEIKSMKKEDLKSYLLNHNLINENTNLSRQDMVDLLILKQESNNVLTATADDNSSLSQVASNIEEIPESNKELETNQQKLNYNDYVLSLFREDELVDSRPNADGLRRVFQEVIGPILNTAVNVLQTPNVSNLNRATVKYAIQFRDRKTQEIYSIEEVADCDSVNTKFPYKNYPSATAATMAESRALRKRLGIKTLSAEENMMPEDSLEQTNMGINDSTKITDAQKNAITKYCTKLGIDLNKLILDVTSKSSLEETSYTDAQKLLTRINAYERGEKNKGINLPDSLKI